MLVNRISRLTPIRIPGIMIGSVITTRNPEGKGRRERTSGNAAAVPTTTLTSVTWAPTLSVVLSASWIS